MENNFSFKTCTKLMMSLKCAGVRLDSALVFFAENIVKMQSCPPNYGKHKNNGHISYKIDNCWIMRGFYPGTSVMFRIVMVKSNGQYNAPTEGFYARVEEPRITIPHGKPNSIYLTPKEIKTLMDKEANLLLLGDTDGIHDVGHRTPKCYSPKGCNTYNLSVKRK